MQIAKCLFAFFLHTKNIFTNNNIMNSWWLIFIVGFIFLMIININVKVKLTYNFIKNIGLYKIMLFNIPIVQGKFYYKKKYIVYYSKKNKSKYIPLTSSDEKYNYYNDLGIMFFNKIDLISLLLYIDYGSKNEPMNTSLIIGALRVIITNFSCILKAKKYRSTIITHIYPNFAKNSIKASVKSNIAISIVDLIWIVLKSRLSQIKENIKYGKQNRKPS